MLISAIIAATAFVYQPDIDAVERQVRAMRPKTNVWRELQWDTCLIDGLERSQKENKPILLWVFLHNPNEERC